MMSYLDEEEYDPDNAHFTQEQLGALTPARLMLWFNYKVYENPEPGDADDQAQLEPLVRSNSIKYWKKAISYFMPNRLQPWNVLSNSGNPTRCTDINDLIKRILRREVTIDRLVRQGLTANVAIDRIYEVYGRELTVTRLINRMLSDRRNNSIPAVLQ